MSRGVKTAPGALMDDAARRTEIDFRLVAVA